MYDKRQNTRGWITTDSTLHQRNTRNRPSAKTLTLSRSDTINQCVINSPKSSGNTPCVNHGGENKSRNICRDTYYTMCTIYTILQTTNHCLEAARTHHTPPRTVPGDGSYQYKQTEQHVWREKASHLTLDLDQALVQEIVQHGEQGADVGDVELPLLSHHHHHVRVRLRQVRGDLITPALRHKNATGAGKRRDEREGEREDAHVQQQQGVK